jgi:hypothetical protein
MTGNSGRTGAAAAVRTRNAGSGIERNLTVSSRAPAHRLMTSGKLIVCGPNRSCTWPEGPSSATHRAAICPRSCTEMGEVGYGKRPARFAAVPGGRPGRAVRRTPGGQGIRGVRRHARPAGPARDELRRVRRAERRGIPGRLARRVPGPTSVPRNGLACQLTWRKVGLIARRLIYNNLVNRHHYRGGSDVEDGGRPG